ncbi:hypothetical protein D9615_010167 [Tricholomella constricta]|uniref:UBA domain-containing protein n=1 Tax=Tricholomella constricta TaxID=117010 RepID=A0A8H5GR44_9AGAR|nr:hypothetical protein D9615_010167 [Tricholomella constricta]
MSDSFADLWNSSAPSKPAPQPQKLGAATPTSNPTRRPQQDAFSLLSSTGSSNIGSRSITPSGGNTMSQRTTPNPPTKPSLNGGDAFSGLLSGSLAAGANGGARMTIAERAAEAERQKIEKLKRHQHAVKTHGSSAWDGLDSLAKSSTQSLPSSSAKPAAGGSLLVDDWGLDSFVSAPVSKVTSAKPTPPPAPAAVADDDDWLGGFADSPVSQPKPQRSVPSAQAKAWMHENDDSPTSIPARRRTDSPGDFDFGNREDALLDDDSNDEDDILGALSKPVDAIQKRRPPPTTNQTTNRNTPSPNPPSQASIPRSNGSRNGTPSSRPVSPPPHILGQIVEMGFSVQQARVALAATDTGLDVQAALETLLSNGAGSGPPLSQPSLPQSAESHHPPLRGTARLMQHEHQREHSTPSPSHSQLDRERNIQDQADKLIAQASEIGLSVFKQASMFWKEGKERVQKAYVERAAPVVGASSTTAPAGGARPKWMTEPIHDGESGEDPWKEGLREPGGFSDDVRAAAEQSSRQNQQQRSALEPKPQRTTTDLFADDPEPTAYVSPFRRGKAAAAAGSSSSSAAAPAAESTRALVRTTPLPTRRQNLVSASATALALANKHKDAGTAKFKLGQFAEAESAYTTGIGALPPGHLLLVPLHNNRALARLRTGDHAGAVADAGLVVELVGVGYHPAREVRVEREEEGAGVELGDALVKALKRRAEAWEGREKWEEAGRDWNVLAGLEWAGAKVRGDAARAGGRCRSMVAQSQGARDAPPPRSGSTAVQKSTPRPRPKPPVKPASLSRPAPPSQALENLRTANDAADAEDQQRHELKDSVDAKLLAWKGGKETNIRALLGSLDTVLWPELGMPKVGMAELVTPGQVKVKYTRAIAKLHPDKLNAGNTTVEQRMIANSVFGALNEAWNAFKQ